MLFNPLWWTTKLWLFFCYIILFLFLWVCCYGCKRQGRGCIWERPQQWKSWNEIRHRPENLWHQIFSPNNRLYYPWARCSHSSDPPMSTGAYTVQRPSTSIFCVFSLLYSTHDKRVKYNSKWPLYLSIYCRAAQMFEMTLSALRLIRIRILGPIWNLPVMAELASIYSWYRLVHKQACESTLS